MAANIKAVHIRSGFIIPFARGNARGPAEKQAVYFRTRGTYRKMHTGEKLTAEKCACVTN